MSGPFDSSTSSSSSGSAPSTTLTSKSTTAQTPPEHSSDVSFPTAVTDPQTLTATLLLTSSILFSIRIYKRRLRRIPTTAHLRPHDFTSTSSTSALFPLQRSRSLLGYPTSTNDPDNLRFYHTPGGRLLAWGTPLRPVPSTRAALKDQTLPVRIAGIDAPELAHFGKPAQPFADESLVILKSIVEGRRVRIWPLRRDQYERVVCLVMVRRSLFTWGEGWIRGLREEGVRHFWRRDVGLEMLRRGAATVYEGKFGAEFGGKKREEAYRFTEGEAKRRKVGMWKGGKTIAAKGEKNNVGFWGRLFRKLSFEGDKTANEGKIESPREYKLRMAEKDAAKKSH